MYKEPYINHEGTCKNLLPYLLINMNTTVFEEFAIGETSVLVVEAFRHVTHVFLKISLEILSVT